MLRIGIKYASLSFGVGLGWGGCNNVHGNLNIRHAMLWDLLLHCHAYVMRRCGIFSCTGTHTSCDVVGSSLALAHIRHATLWDLLLHWHTYVMLPCAFLTVRLPNMFFSIGFSSLLFPISRLSVLPTGIVSCTGFVSGLL